MLFRIHLVEGSNLTGFADDIAVLVHAKEIRTLNERTNDSLERVDKWLREHYLELAPEKSEALFPKCPRNIRLEIDVKIRGTPIYPKKTVKYMGVMLDWQGTFTEHVKYVCKKADERAAALNRILPNIRGPREEKRRLLAGVVYCMRPQFGIA